MAVAKVFGWQNRILQDDLRCAANSLERAAGELGDAAPAWDPGHVGTAICGIRNAIAKAQAVLDELVEEDMAESLKEPDL